MTLLYRTSATVTTTGAAPSSDIGGSHPPAHPHRSRPAAGRTSRTLRNQQPTRLRAPADARDLAHGSTVASTGRDRPAGVRLGPMLGLPLEPQLHVHRLEQLRHPAGVAMPDRVAWPARRILAGAGQMADPVHRPQVRVAGRGTVVPAAARLVLTEAGTLHVSLRRHGPGKRFEQVHLTNPRSAT